jgi:hypothetical protein
MEKTNGEKIKVFFLATFVLLCVGLILTLWVNAFVENDVETPYFYRGIPDFSESFDATETALAEQYTPVTSTPTPAPTMIQPTFTPVPTATFDLLLNFTPESDN